MVSIQRRLTLYIIVGTAVVLMGTGMTIDYLLHNQLEREFDRNLLSKAMTLVALTEQDDEQVEFDFSYEFMPEYDIREKPEYFELWLADGTVIERSRSLGDTHLPRKTEGLGKPRFAELILPDGRSGRIVRLTFLPAKDEDEEDDEENEKQQDTTRQEGSENRSPEASTSGVRLEIALAKGRDDLDHLITNMRTTLFVAFLSLMVALGLLARVSVNRGLRPLKKIAKDVQGLDASRLHMRLSDVTASEELAPITNQLNHLLERLEDAFQREKRFSGNVAHELRTPIAELRTMAEVGKQWPADREMVKRFFGDLVDLANDMERTVNNLMMLSQLDAGTQRVELESINLSRLIDKIWKRLVPEADRKEVRLDNRVRDDLEVHSDGDKLRLILINLLSNAVSYSPDHSVIVVEAKETETGARLAVSNPTVDLAEQDLPMMFERFWRKDEARTGGRHAGLGLSLVQALADILSLKISPELDGGRRFTIMVSEFQSI
jgi:two-component system sensor histidine kinase QseC